MQNSLYFSLNKEINAQYLLNQIQTLVNGADKDKSKILKISIQYVDQENYELIPKLEHKNEQQV